MLGITTKAVAKNLKHRGLTGTGHGKARRIPRAPSKRSPWPPPAASGRNSATTTSEPRRGSSALADEDAGIGANPLETLTLLNTAADVRHGAGN